MSASDVPLLVFLSVAGVSLQFILQVTALVYTTATNFSLLFNLSAFFIMIFGVMFLGERLEKKHLAGAGIAFAGVALIVSGGGFDLSAAHLPGDLLGLASALLFGVYSTVAKRAAGRLRPLTLLVYTFFFGVLGLLPVYVFATPMTPLTALSPLSWASLLFLALCCSVVAFLVYNHGIGRAPGVAGGDHHLRDAARRGDAGRPPAGRGADRLHPGRGGADHGRPVRDASHGTAGDGRPLRRM